MAAPKKSLRPKSYQSAITQKKPKTFAQARENLLSDVRMGLGIDKKTSDFKARTRRTMDKAAEDAKKRKRDNDRKPSTSATSRQAELTRQQEIAEAQARRREYEKQRGKEARKRRMLLLNISGS